MFLSFLIYFSFSLFYVTKATSTIYFQHSTNCSTGSLLPANLTCQDDPLYFKVLPLKSTAFSTPSLVCGAMCKLVFNAISASGQKISFNYYKAGTTTALGTPAIISIPNKWTILSYSFPNPGGSFFVSFSNSNSAIVNDILVSDLFATDEKGFSSDEVNSLYQSYKSVSVTRFLQNTNSYDLTTLSTNLSIVGQMEANTVRYCNSMPIIGGNDQMKLVGKTTPNSFSLTFGPLTNPHFAARVSLDLYLEDTWANENIFLSVNGIVYSTIRPNAANFITGSCGNTNKFLVFSEMIEVAFPSDQTTLTITISTDTTKSDSVASFGFRNVSVTLLQCSQLCKKCVGPLQDNCSTCVDNANVSFGKCLCNITYNQMGDFYCGPVEPNTTNCLILDSNFWTQAILNYFCYYFSEKELHSLVLSYYPYYSNFSSCLTFKLFPQTNPNYLITPTITQDINSQRNNISFSFTTDFMRNQYLCPFTDTENYLTFSCNFTIESYYLTQKLTYSYFVYEFQFNKKTQDTAFLYATPVLVRVGDCCCGSVWNGIVGYCRDDTIFKSQVFLCKDELCASTYDDPTAKVTYYYNQPLHLVHRIMNSSLLSQYTLSVASLVLSCDNVLTNLPFGNFSQGPGQVIIHTMVILTGNCILTIKSSIVSYIKQSRRQLVNQSPKLSNIRILSDYLSLKQPRILEQIQEGMQIQTGFNIEFVKPNATEGESEGGKGKGPNDDWKRIAIIVGATLGSVFLIVLIAGSYFLVKYIRVKKNQKYITPRDTVLTNNNNNN